MKHSCDKEIRKDDWAMSGYRIDGDKWKCSCGNKFMHVCSEADGCYWLWVKSKVKKYVGFR